ncbi:MAG: hypothetical protein DRG78_13220 [Epsilonproteobacteria bacterium]|nr:MAG: hypothetical protein DRG78_13220 [Campylobacterota bacterium]
MKNTIILSLLFATIVFTACSSDNSSSSTSIQTHTIELKTYCVQDTTLDAIGTYVTLQKYDILVNDEKNTQVEIYHDENNNKKVCLVSGSAHILRY